MFFSSRQVTALGNTELQRKAPAVFASQEKSSLSDKYLFIPTIRLIDGLRSNGWEVVSAAQTMNRKSSTEKMLTNKHALFFARRDDLGKELDVNGVMPLIKLENSHNGLSSFGLSSGFFRKVCANGLTIPDSIYSAPTVKHTVNLANDVVEATYKVLRDFPELMNMQKSLSGLNLTQDERFLLADAAADIFFTKQERDDANIVARQTRDDRFLIESQLTRAVRYGDRGTDLWTVTNVIQENLIRGNIKTRNEQNRLVSKRKVTSIDRDNDIPAKLFKLTQKFAELKGLKIGVTA